MILVDLTKFERFANVSVPIYLPQFQTGCPRLEVLRLAYTHIDLFLPTKKEQVCIY